MVRSAPSMLTSLLCSLSICSWAGQYGSHYAYHSHYSEQEGNSGLGVEDCSGGSQGMLVVWSDIVHPAADGKVRSNKRADKNS
jgi:hypothetical protein